MANKRSDKSPYPSRYSPNHWVTPAQYIIEFVCEQAAKHTKSDLPLRFWKQDGWEKFFIAQTRKANQYLKKYDEKAILNAVKKSRIRTLLPRWVEGVIQKEQKILDAQKKRTDNRPKPQKSIINKPKVRTARMSSKLDKFLALDEEIEHGKEKENRNY